MSRAMTVSEAARLMGCSVETIHARRRQGKLRPESLSPVMINADDVMEARAEALRKFDQVRDLLLESDDAPSTGEAAQLREVIRVLIAAADSFDTGLRAMLGEGLQAFLTNQRLLRDGALTQMRDVATPPR